MDNMTQNEIFPPLLPLNIRVQKATKHYGPDDGAYRNISEPRGAVFIGNFREFDVKTKLEIRYGSEKDFCNLKELFSQMGYQVIGEVTDTTKDSTLKALLTFRDERIHSDVDSLVVIFMSHGEKNGFCAYDGKFIHCNEIIEKFRNDNCPALRGKPKLFIFQFCRGEEEHIQINSSKDSQNITDSKKYSPQKRAAKKLSDIYIGFSTVEGFVSYRRMSGGYYIHHICRVFMEHVKDDDFDTLMERVERELPEVQASEVIKKGITQKFHFNPPIKETTNDNSLSISGMTEEDPYECSIQEENSSSAYRNCDNNSALRNIECRAEDIYKMSSTPRGHVLIINNLRGCQEDEKKLSDIFKQIGFNVLETLCDATFPKLMEELENFKLRSHHDSAIIIFLGKGFEDSIVTFDGTAINFRYLTNLFNDVNCPGLAGKPKIFIFNTCFTDTFSLPGQTHSGGSWVRTHSGDTPQSASNLSPANKDMIILSVEVNEGNCEEGSLLTEALYQILLASETNTQDLSTVMRLISERLHEFSEGNEVQYSTEIIGIRFQKKFYFNPPKPDTTDSVISSPLERARRYNFENIIVQKTKKTKLKAENCIYRNESHPRGYAILICYTAYQTNSLPDCNWREVDMRMIKSLFEELGYKTETCINLAVEEVKSRLQEFQDKDEHRTSDSTIVMVIGHAQDVNNFYDVKGHLMPVADILHLFTDDNCSQLKEKPKIFFFHMTELKKWNNTFIAQPDDNLRDAFSLYLISSVQNNIHPVEGICTLRKAIEEHVHYLDLENIMIKAEETLIEGGHGGCEKYLRKPIRFLKDFYLNPRSLMLNKRL